MTYLYGVLIVLILYLMDVILFQMSAVFVPKALGLTPLLWSLWFVHSLLYKKRMDQAIVMSVAVSLFAWLTGVQGFFEVCLPLLILICCALLYHRWVACVTQGQRVGFVLLFFTLYVLIVHLKMTLMMSDMWGYFLDARVWMIVLVNGVLYMFLLKKRFLRLDQKLNREGETQYG